MGERVSEIYSLLVPLVNERLIVPRSCVAEVIGYQPPAEMTGAPPWYLGVVAWNNRSLPLVSFEGCCGEDIPPATSRSRIVILHAVSPRIDAGYFAIVSQGFPQLVRVSSDVVKPDVSRSFGERVPVICQLRMLNEAPLVPDLDRLEGMVAEETSILPI
ncbi:MAG TPA: chemotaxis protein CheW [Steroidobacteraceae bacterium]|jgi:chemosensory pili system protein ChpC|nr:chemotaxis protein CheW [Steroidobacteraceae bacterium]